MFKSDQYVGRVRDLFTRIGQLEPVSQRVGAPPIACPQPGSMLMHLCDEPEITFIIPNHYTSIFLCPAWFENLVLPSSQPPIRPGIVSNKFALNSRGQAFEFGKVFDLLSGMISIYTQRLCTRWDPPAVAVGILNFAVGLRPEEAFKSWETLAGFVLSAYLMLSTCGPQETAG